jgi:hypothetical protein
MRPFTNGNLFTPTFLTNFSDATTSTSLTTPWGYFFTLSQAARPPFRLNDGLFHLAAGRPNLTNALSFTTNNRINLNRNLTTLNLPQNTSLPRNFLTNAAGGVDLTRELDSLISSKIDRADITNRFRSSFTQKYSRDVLRQILVNINDLNFASQVYTSTPTATTGSANTNSDGIPSQYSGLQNFVYLNEVATRVAYNPRRLSITGQGGSGNSTCEVQIWLKFELVNPFSIPMGNQSEINFMIDNFSATANYISANGTPGSAILNRGTVPALGPQSGNTIVSQDVQPGSYLPTSGSDGTSNSGNLTFGLEYQFYEGNRTFNIPPGAQSITVSNVSFQIIYSKLLQSAGNNTTVRDWSLAQDFSGHGAADGTLSFNGGSVSLVTTSLKQSDGSTSNFQEPAGSIQDFNTGSVLGIAKNDPRVRRFPNWATPVTAWFPVSGSGNSRLTFGRQNSVVNFSASSGSSGIPADRITGNFTEIFKYSANITSTDQSYKSLTELGKVHTGLQWRTLNIAAQNPTEANAGHIPDWALLDAFYITNNIPKLNINSIVYPAANISGVNQSTAGLLRTPAVASLLAGGTNTPTPADNVPPTSSMALTGTNSFLTLATNIAAMNFTTNWAGRRGTNFPANQYALLGEVLEVAGVASFSNNDAVNEGRAASFIDAVSLHSDVFSIYSVGYALDRQGRNVGEFMLRTQVQLDRSTGKFRKTFVEPVRVSNLPMP